MILSALIYIVAVLGANYTATWFIHFPVFGQVAVGTFIFGLTFTQRDRLHAYGRRWVYGTIAVAAIANVLMSAYLEVPFRIILASFTAILISEGVDTEIYQHLLQKRWLFRVATSNAVSIPLDTMLFGVIAFLGVLSTREILSLFVGEIIVKYAIGIISALWKARETTPATETSSDNP
ncbi:VUT family protein [Oscillatoria sp. FACHB-1407]|uniref:VUT family protein n=1 Tax=Oscillatoria sp. FACHB-1407 TaxID=2692847 RepID=UPI0016864770|nr:VUT family protein [Oscillatoria sp. FACHB-1407]MBD2461799.1 VUT family protein [Oscillatoria sp. FACHB-1407]